MASLRSNLLRLTVKNVAIYSVTSISFILLIWVLFFSQKDYLLEYNQSHPVRRSTRNLEISYYVRDNFDLNQEEITELEHSIEADHLSSLDRKCDIDLRSYRRQQNPAMPPICERLRRDFTKLDQKCSEELNKRSRRLKEVQETYGWKSNEYLEALEIRAPSCQFKTEFLEIYKTHGEFRDPVQKLDEV